METNNKCLRVGFSAALWGILTTLLCAAPCGAYDGILTVGVGDTVNLGTEYGPLYVGVDNGYADVYGTLNMYRGAYVDQGVYTYPGSVVNIYAGSVGWWLQVIDGGTVTIYGTAFKVGDDVVPFGEWTPPTGDDVLTVTYEDAPSADLRIISSIAINLVDASGGSQPIPVEIDIKPGSYPNTINLGSNGVVPVAILSTEGFDATALDPTTVFLAGSGVAVRGKGKSLAHEEDVNADGWMDLVVQVETENLDPGTFQDGGAVLQVKDGETVLYEGWDEITIVPPE